MTACKKCFWDSMCDKIVPDGCECDDFTLYEEDEDRIIEEGRERFRKEWFQYIHAWKGGGDNF